MDKNYIIRYLDESNKEKQRYKELYLHCTDIHDKKLYKDLYLKSMEIHYSRYQMMLLFGYDTVVDENGNIIDIKEI